MTRCGSPYQKFFDKNGRILKNKPSLTSPLIIDRCGIVKFALKILDSIIVDVKLTIFGGSCSSSTRILLESQDDCSCDVMYILGFLVCRFD